MKYALTPNNIRLRYLAAKDEAKRARKSGDKGARFTYTDMANLFLVSEDACYSWTLPKGERAAREPSQRRAEMLYAWINDGKLEAYIRRVS